MKQTMKVWKVLLPVAAVSLMAWSCTRGEIPGQAGNDRGAGNDVVAVFADAGTRTTLGEGGNVLWSTGDGISVFLQTKDNRKYVLDGEGGETSGTFKYAEGTTDGEAVTYNFGVYPYSEANKLTEEGTLQVTVPTVQPYAENGFADGTNVAVAVSEDRNLTFKNVCGYIKIPLYGDGVKVKRIVVTGAIAQAITGIANVTVALDTDPVVASVEDEGEKEAIVEAEEAVALGATEKDPTMFWLALLPGELANGISVEITAEDADGEEFTMNKTSRESLTIVRSKVSEFPALKVEPEIPDVEKQWIFWVDENNQLAEEGDEGAVKMVYDFGATFEGKILYFAEDDQYVGYPLNSFPYQISLTKEGDVMVSWDDPDYEYYFYIFRDVTETSATRYMYFSQLDPNSADYSGDIAQGHDDYGYYFLPVPVKTPDSYIPAPANKHPVLSIDGVNYMMNGMNDDFDHGLRFLNDVMGGSSCTLPFVRMNNYGTKEDYEGVDVTGKIVVVDRGTIPFWEKLQYASEAGASAVLCVYQGLTGAIYPNVSDLPSDVKIIPFLLISGEAGEALNGQTTATFDILSEPPFVTELK